MPEALAGPLAAHAWAHHGSMRAEHAHVLREAGDPVPDRLSTAEVVLDRWMSDPRLGPRWPAFTSAAP